MAATLAQGPFSHPNRVRLIDAYFGDRAVTPETAWQHVYRLLLWVDARTGIAHCYESDKSQPGRAWYPRSLLFHDWVSSQLDVDPLDLKDHIDFMFRHAAAAAVEREAAQLVQAAQHVQQRLFSRHDVTMPVPGDDPRLRDILEPLMPQAPGARPSEELLTAVMRKIYAHMGSENKRANLLGRGFEDVIAGVIGRLTGTPPRFGTQTPLEDIPGFRATRAGDKTEKVDLWVGDGQHRRILVNAKWSVRADREKQMAIDFGVYDRHNELREPFEYIWITNEFDPARLVTNATNSAGNRLLFDVVVHICPEALYVVHELRTAKKLRDSPKQLRELLEAGRIIGFGDWLSSLPAEARPNS